MCTVLLPPGVNPIAVNKYIVISYHETGSVVADTVMFSLVLREFVNCVKVIRKNYAEMAFGKHIFRYKI
jgi:hypothetical protein